MSQRDEEHPQKRHRDKQPGKKDPRQIPGSRRRCGLQGLPKAAAGKIAGIAPADLRYRREHQHQGRRRAAENLKWGQPSDLTPGTKSGSVIRIDRMKSDANRYAVYFHCQTDLVETFRELYPTELRYGGNRSILLDTADDIPEPALRHCVALALTYHLNKRK
jgi:hypothetical protein